MAVNGQIQRRNEEFSPQQVFLVQKERLAAVLVECTNLPLEVVKKCIQRLCFDASSRSHEAWDAPLVRVNGNLLLVTPVLVTTGDPIRILENLASEWDERLFTERGPLLEREAVSFLGAVDGVVAAGPVTFTSSSEGRNVEFDVLARWEDQIFLIEAKCTKLVFGARDLHRARVNIDEAVDQLVLRKRVLLNEWQQIRAMLPDVCCEVKPVSPERICMIVLTNIPYFTGAKVGDVLVVDEFAFRRYFDSPAVHAVAGGHSLGELFSLRRGARPTAAEFREYLANPPQVAAFEKLMKAGFFYHTIVRDVKHQTLGGHFKTGNDKKKGKGNTKNGNKYLSWAFVEAANFAIRFSPKAQLVRHRLERHNPLRLRLLSVVEAVDNVLDLESFDRVGAEANCRCFG
jgi:hypothetical protein